MTRSFSSKWVSILAATSMLALPGLAGQMPQAPAQQSGSSQSSQNTSTAPTSSSSSSASTSQTSGSQAPSTSAPQSTGSNSIYVPPPSDAQPSQSASTSTSSAQQPASPADTNTIPKGVKPGSKNDVDAIGNRDVGKGLDFYSIEHEIALGKQLSQEVEKTAKFINDPVVVEYVNRVGQNIVRNSDCKVPFTIKVIDSDEVNAFALPGGFFYVNSGLILHADEESELAAVMGHETAHVCLRHGTKQATKADIAQLASIPAMIFIPYSWAGYAMYQG
ncbi:MAG TPA: M48 family metalloprotease, partial [Bryobacteraceae bacterium]